LATFITSCKSSFSGAGYSGPCTTTEPLNIWQENTAVLCEVVDVIGCNIHPFFNGDVTADQAGSFVASQLAIVDSLCSGKSGINLETGWPSAGDCNGAACPGTSEQATAVAGITSSAGGKSVMFSFVNDLWKDAGAFNCEQSWGAIQLFP
jgi:exo-beta-1,3-glucanase (GH17 family)